MAEMDQGGDGRRRRAAGVRRPGARGRAAAGALAALLALAVAGCETPRGKLNQAPADPEIVRSSVRFQKEYILFAGDQVEVSVWRVPEVSRTVFVRPDGFISLPLAQEIKAAGLTPRELAANVEQALSRRLVKPEVTVIPVAVRQPTVYVLGDVKSPGAYPARNAITAAQALALAGGALRSGSENYATIIRLTDDGYLEGIPAGGQPSLGQADPYVTLAATPMKADDILFVPESGRSQVFRALSDLLVPYQIYLNYKLIQSLY